MNETVIYRQAEEKDIDFLVDVIIEAEKSGTDVLSYVTVFGISEIELRKVLKEILAEDMTGQELCVSGYIIAEVNGEYAGACCAWVEGECGLSSPILKASLLYHYFGKEQCQMAESKSEMLKSLYLEREKGEMQLESALIPDKYKGKGIVREIFKKLIERHKKQTPEISKVQIVMIKPNERGVRAYKKAGFRIVAEKLVDDDEILKVLPSNNMILLEKSL